MFMIALVADKQHALQAGEASLFRIASVTKPITSVAIFMLVEQGKLNLNDKVFGLSGVLGTKYGGGPYKQYVTDVTVDHLLTHTSGGWPNDSTDPMFSHDGWDQAKLIAWTIENLPLTYPPGQHWAYSNFGYCVLGRVIEAVTGQTYAAWVQANVLALCGITGMKIAENKESQRAPNEVVYYGQFCEDPYKINVARMDSHGGWIASSSDLVQFLNHVAGAPGIPRTAEAGYNPTDDDTSTSLRSERAGEVRARMDAKEQWHRQLVAQRQSARVDDHHGADNDRDMLGCTDKYALPAFEPDRYSSGPNDVEYCAMRAGLGCVVHNPLRNLAVCHDGTSVDGRGRGKMRIPFDFDQDDA